jgi:hypothetical protein
VPRRGIGLSLLLVGIVALVVGLSAGCGALFSFNGRHPLAVAPLTVGTTMRGTFAAKPGRRYSVAVHVVFERPSTGLVDVEARFPLVATIDQSPGAAARRVTGWLDPHEAPTVLYGRGAREAERRPTGMAPAELVAERLVGPYEVTAARDVGYAVELGADQVGRARVSEARVVVYDDALPRSIARGLALAAAGVLALASGALLLAGARRRARHGGTRGRPIV